MFLINYVQFVLCTCKWDFLVFSYRFWWILWAPAGQQFCMRRWLSVIVEAPYCETCCLARTSSTSTLWLTDRWVRCCRYNHKPQTSLIAIFPQDNSPPISLYLDILTYQPAAQLLHNTFSLNLIAQQHRITPATCYYPDSSVIIKTLHTLWDIQGGAQVTCGVCVFMWSLGAPPLVKVALL